MTYIMTAHGNRFDFSRPGSYQYDEEEIAVALSRLCRFTGHGKSFYSVAQHSVMVARMCCHPQQLEGLMHDASEAYLGDVSSPLKAMLPEYKAIEHTVEKAIARSFGLATDAGTQSRVKWVDLRMLVTEASQLHEHYDPDDWPKVQPYDLVLEPWQPDHAAAMFLETYRELVCERR